MRAERPIFIQFGTRHRNRLPFLLRDALHFPVNLILRGADAFLIGNFLQQQRSLYTTYRGITLLFA